MDYIDGNYIKKSFDSLKDYTNAIVLKTLLSYTECLLDNLELNEKRFCNEEDIKLIETLITVTYLDWEKEYGEDI